MDDMSPECSQGSDELSSAVSLRVFDPADADDVIVWAADELVTQFCWCEPYTCREQAVEFINKSVKHPYMKAICLKNRVVGAISVTSNLGRDRCRGELGYVLASCFWGKGIATRAVKLVTSTIFSEWPFLVRLEALVDVENWASLRVLEKVGFKREGILRKYLIFKGGVRDMVMFSLLSTDPQANDKVTTSEEVVTMDLCSDLEGLIMF